MFYFVKSIYILHFVLTVIFLKNKDILFCLTIKFFIFMRTSWLDVLFVLFQTILESVTAWFLVTLLAAISCWGIGLLFDEAILGILSSFGFTGFTMWEIGAFLGFVLGFYRIIIQFKK